MLSLPITSKVVSLIPEGILNIQHYVIVCWRLAAGQWFFSRYSINKTYRHDITEILLKVALNTITLMVTFIQNVSGTLSKTI
jgi:hypothetical protein